MLNFLNAKVWLYLQPIDFRKQLDSLIIEVAANLKKTPHQANGSFLEINREIKLKFVLIFRI